MPYMKHLAVGLVGSGQSQTLGYEADTNSVRTRLGTSRYFVEVYRVTAHGRELFADVYGGSAEEAQRRAVEMASSATREARPS